MSDLEFDILDELYFVSSFASLKGTLNTDEDSLVAALSSLLEKKFIHQLVFIPEHKDFIRLEMTDFAQLKDSSFVASKDGLLAHNQR